MACRKTMKPYDNHVQLINKPFGNARRLLYKMFWEAGPRLEDRIRFHERTNQKCKFDFWRVFTAYILHVHLFFESAETI